MKCCIVLLLAAGFGIVVANPVLKQTIADKNSLLSESNDSNNHEEMTTNNKQIEQRNIKTNVNADAAIGDRFGSDKTIEIDIEENARNTNDQFSFQEAIDNQAGLENNEGYNLQEYIDTNPESGFEMVKEGDYYYNDVIYKDPNEVMETAAGFVPVPIFRRRQKQTPHRNIASRRHHRRPYVSRRHYYFYPYYSFYRPSSLRYYY